MNHVHGPLTQGHQFIQAIDLEQYQNHSTQLAKQVATHVDTFPHLHHTLIELLKHGEEDMKRYLNYQFYVTKVRHTVNEKRPPPYNIHRDHVPEELKKHWDDAHLIKKGIADKYRKSIRDATLLKHANRVISYIRFLTLINEPKRSVETNPVPLVRKTLDLAGGGINYGKLPRMTTKNGQMFHAYYPEEVVKRTKTEISKRLVGPGLTNIVSPSRINNINLDRTIPTKGFSPRPSPPPLPRSPPPAVRPESLSVYPSPNQRIPPPRVTLPIIQIPPRVTLPIIQTPSVSAAEAVMLERVYIFPPGPNGKVRARLRDRNKTSVGTFNTVEEALQKGNEEWLRLYGNK